MSYTYHINNKNINIDKTKTLLVGFRHSEILGLYVKGSMKALTSFQTEL